MYKETVSEKKGYSLLRDVNYSYLSGHGRRRSFPENDSYPAKEAERCDDKLKMNILTTAYTSRFTITTRSAQSRNCSQICTSKLAKVSQK